MATLISGFMKLDKLEEIVKVLKDRGDKGFKMTIKLTDESNDYGQNVQMWAEQSKEQKDAGTPRYFCGNGRVTWTDGTITLGKKKDEGFQANANSQPALNEPKDDVPF